ncbi:hypothetical protein ATO49_22485 [Mycolicibacterium fortuitum subsp. fortuitum DSM 46621 = ATCC 6841 = JCM 6387]|nr:hypothetical protein ATO49_22485 [Mycolicibacterium fortuitum subsp. fortuitum DSM 46621 = ATCC 6841 = JCM 6387]
MTTISHLPARYDAAGLDSLLDDLAGVAARGEVPGPDLLTRVTDALPELATMAADPNDGEPYSRTILRVDEVEIMLARWRPGQRCAPHDHGGAGGFVIVLQGGFEERRFDWDGPRLTVTTSTEHHTGEVTSITSDVIHDMAGLDGGIDSAFLQSARDQHAGVRSGPLRDAGTGRQLRCLDSARAAPACPVRSDIA